MAVASSVRAVAWWGLVDRARRRTRHGHVREREHARAVCSTVQELHAALRFGEQGGLKKPAGERRHARSGLAFSPFWADGMEWNG